MAFEPYLLTRKRGCYRAPLSYKKDELTPECKPDLYTSLFRQRWDILREKDDCCRPPKNESFNCPIDIRTGAYSKVSRNPNDICLPNIYTRKYTAYNQDYPHPLPLNHNHIDDCCKAPCPCDNGEDAKAPQINYICTPKCPGEPLDDRTTYGQFFTAKPIPPRPQRKIEPWDPCGCPLESATSNRLDYPHKRPVPNGPVMAQVIKGGLWSLDQFSNDPFPDETETNSEYTKKYGRKLKNLRHPNNLACGEGPMEDTSETCYQYPPKQSPNLPEIPDWLQNDIWIKLDTPMESCTTYKHFYRRHPVVKHGDDFNNNIVSPGAVPFSTMHNMWYTCCDPKVDQTTPVEMKDNDPWPYVRVCPIRYQNNLQTDPCAPFRDDTTNKADFTPKARCVKATNYAPCRGYTLPIQPFNDDTTNRVSYKAYSPDEYKYSKTNSGNPRGTRWGPFKCPPDVDKCQPRFPAPYGHPLKPYTLECRCGPFDDRSTYHSDFKFRSQEMVDVLNAEMCRQPNMVKGVSLYRHDYVAQHGRRALRMPPPTGKGYRCVHPSSLRDTDTLYRMENIDFWKLGDVSKLQLYRGKRTDDRALANDAIRAMQRAESEEPEHFQIIAMPPGTTVQDVLDSCSK